MRVVLAAPGRPYDLLLVCSIAGLTVLLSIMGVSNLLVSMLAFICIYFSPGYALVSALFPGRTANLGHLLSSETTSESEITMLERLVASVVLSLLVFALGSIGLAWTPDGLTESLVLAEVLVLNIAISAVAMSRRFRLPKEEEFALVLEIGVGRGKGRLNGAEKAVLVLASAGIVLAALAGAGLLGKGIGAEPYTEFYITGPDGSLGTLPQTLAAGRNGTVVVAFENQMGEGTEYNLTVGVMRDGAFQNHTGLDWEAVHSLVPGDAYQRNVTVPQGEKYSQRFILSFSSPGTYQVMFELRYGTMGEDLWLWVTVT